MPLLSMRIYLLGRLRIEHDGAEPSQIPALPRLRKTQGLLAYLLLHHNQPTTRDQLAYLFWGDTSDERARDSLTTALKQLRAMLVTAELTLQADRKHAQIIFGANTWLDVDTVKRGLAHNATSTECEQALQLYKADLLEGWTDEWCIEEREQLRNKVLRLGTTILQSYLSQSQWKEGYVLAEQLLLHDPLDETLHEMAVRSLLGSNDYAGARRHYQQFAALLRNQLDLDPGSTLQGLFGQTLRERLPHTDVHGLLPASGAGEQAAQTPQRLPFVGRAHERGVLLAALSALYRQGADHDTSSARGTLILIEGDAGMGKTRLVDEVIANFAEAGRHINVLQSKASEAGKDLPFGPLLAPLGRWLLGELAPAQVLQRLGSSTIATLAQIMPSLASRFPNLPVLPELPPDTAHTRVLQGMVAALQGLGTAQSPVILVLDDLQWADASTIQVLDQLRAGYASQLNIPLMLIGTYRSADSPPHIKLLDLAEKLSSDEGSVLHIKPLTQADVQQAIEKRMPTDRSHLSKWLHEQSDGNAFYLAELLQGLKEDGRIVADLTVGGWRLADGAQLPAASSALTLPRIESAILRRFSNLSNNCQNLVRVIAVLAQADSFPVIASASDLVEDAALSGLEEGMSRRFIRWTAEIDAYTVSHDLIRAVLVKSMSPARRQRLHARVAEALEEGQNNQQVRLQSSELPILIRLAYHYGETTRLDKQRYYFSEVARSAQDSYASDVAVEYYKRLLPLLPPQERLETMLKMAQLLNVMVQWAEVEDICRQAVSLAETIGDPSMIARARVELARALWLAGRYNESFSQSNLSLELIQQISDPDPGLLIRSAYVLGETHYMVQNYPEATDQFEYALRLLDTPSDSAMRCLILARLGDIYTHLHRFEQASGYHRQALKISRERGDLRSSARALYGIGYLYNMQQDARQAIPLMVEAWQIGALTDYRTMRTPVLSVLTSCYLVYGEYEKAYSCAAFHLQLALSAGSYYAATIALTNLGSIQAALNNIDMADTCWQHALQIVSKIENSYEMVDCLSKMAASRLKREHYADALTHAEDAIALARKAQAIEFECDLLLIRLVARFKLGDLQQSKAIDECKTMLLLYKSEWEQAAILFTLQAVDPGREKAKYEAAAAYKSLYAEHPTAAYRSKYNELTGELLPTPKTLTGLPTFVPDPPEDLSALLRATGLAISSMNT